MANIRPTISIKNNKVLAVRQMLERKIRTIVEADDSVACEKLLSEYLAWFVVDEMKSQSRNVIKPAKDAEVEAQVESDADVIQPA